MADASTMVSINIRGIPIKFPFNPYTVQIDYMDRVIGSLQDGNNAMLESPTGTGKTLCLLTSSLAWREYKVRQAEAAQIALAEQTELFLGDEVSRESLEKNNIAAPRAPVIIYASRTHSQISQVVAELHRTVYASSLKICVLGSRSQMCIHPHVSQVKGGMAAMNRACTAYVKRGACSYFSNHERYKQDAVPRTKDIEDLVSWGRKHEVCPFYTAKSQQETADVVFVPYNYIIDPLIRRSLSVELNGAVVILDEAHNLESVANDAASFELSSIDIKLCISLTQQCIDMRNASTLPPLLESHVGGKTNSKNGRANIELNGEESDQEGEKDSETGEETEFLQVSADAALLKETLVNLLSELTSTVFPAGSNAKVSDGKWIYEIFAKVGITNETAHAYLAAVDRVAYEISETAGSYIQPNAPNAVNSYAGANALSSLSESLRKMFMTGLPASEVSNHFKAVLQREQAKVGVFNRATSSKSSPSTYASISSADSATSDSVSSRPNPFDRNWIYKLSLWCFFPGLAMQSLMNTGIRSLIVTSGTLSPLDSFAYELGIPFPVRLENTHVIPTSQIWVGVLPVSVDGESLNSAYSNRSNSYKRSLGRTLVNLVRISPAGMLIFFPSYTLMEECIALWQETTALEKSIWEQICRYKRPVQEPRESKMLKLAMKDYYDKVDAPAQGDLNGAVFFAVCRGKVSEGLDFSNQYGRTVVVTGLPLAQNTDQKVKLKKEYLDNHAMQRKALKPIFSTSLSSSSAAPVPDPAPPMVSSAKNPHQSTDKPLTGADWYAQSAWRAVNQAIGRVIRHRNDYGAIVFVDERFVSAANQQLSKWLRPHVATIHQPGAAFQGITKFFAANAEKFPPHPLLLSSDIDSSTSKSSSSHVSTKPMGVSSHLASANANRRSVFDSLQSAKEANAAATAAAASSSTKKPEASSSPLHSKERAAQVLGVAKSSLSPEQFKEFQTLLKRFKSRSIPRDELHQKLKTMLKDHPEVMAVLKDYLAPRGPNSKNAENNSVTSAPSSSPSTHPTSASPPGRPSNTAISPPKPIPTGVFPPLPGTPSASSSVVSAPKTSKEVNPITIRDSGSLEILEPPPKKRALAELPKSPPPSTKRFHHGYRAANEVPGDSLLDTSVHSNDGESSHSSATKTRTSSSLEITPTHLPSSTSSSLQIVSGPSDPSNSLEIVNDPVSSLGEDMLLEYDPPVVRRASSDVTPPSDPNWSRKLARGNSGGLPSDKKRREPTPAPSSHTTPKKPQIDLISGQMTSSPMRSPPWIRRSPPKTEDASEIAPIPLPSTSNVESEFSSSPIQIESDSLHTSSQSAECPICARTQTNFRTAPCGHSCCLDCWNNWLATKLECPFCRGRVRVKKLEQRPYSKDKT